MPNEEYDDIITLTSENNEEIDFVNIAQIVYQSKIYAILQPVELFDGMDEDEAFVFEVKTDEEGQNSFTIVTDDEIVDEVFSRYNQLLEENEYKVTNVDLSAPGIKVVYVNYLEFSEKYLVSSTDVNDKLLGIEISGTYRTKYNEGEIFQTKGLIVEGVYLNKKMEIFDYTLSITRGLKVEDTSIDILYKGYSKTIEIEVKKDNIIWGPIS